MSYKLGDEVCYIMAGCLMRGTLDGMDSEGECRVNGFLIHRGRLLIPSPMAKIEELYKDVKSLTIDPASLHSREIMGEQRAYEKVLKILKEEEK